MWASTSAPATHGNPALLDLLPGVTFLVSSQCTGTLDVYANKPFPPQVAISHDLYDDIKNLTRTMCEGQGTMFWSWISPIIMQTHRIKLRRSGWTLSIFIGRGISPALKFTFKGLYLCPSSWKSTQHLQSKLAKLIQI